jgi:hypothetical protein
MLFIQELRRDGFLESGGVVPLTFFSALFRLSNAGRFEGVFWGGVAVATGAGAGVGVGAAVAAVAAAAGGRGGDAGRLAAGFGSCVRCCSSWRGLAGMPPCDEVLGGASLLRPGDDGACWRW